MGISESPRLGYQDQLRSLARDLDQAGHGAKGPLKERFCGLHGVSLQTLHRQLNEVGYDAGRKRRHDAGSTKMEHLG
jgi:hypothetical protein